MCFGIILAVIFFLIRESPYRLRTAITFLLLVWPAASIAHVLQTSIGRVLQVVTAVTIVALIVLALSLQRLYCWSLAALVIAAPGCYFLRLAAGVRKALPYRSPFPSTRSRYVLNGILSGRLKTPQDVADWLKLQTIRNTSPDSQ